MSIRITYRCTHGPDATCNVCVHDRDRRLRAFESGKGMMDGYDKGLQTPRLGRLAFWMFSRGWCRLPNAIQSVRYYGWLWTGGSHG